jgi:hypothetical protein
VEMVHLGIHKLHNTMEMVFDGNLTDVLKILHSSPEKPEPFL